MSILTREKKEHKEFPSLLIGTKFCPKSVIKKNKTIKYKSTVLFAVKHYTNLSPIIESIVKTVFWKPYYFCYQLLVIQSAGFTDQQPC